MPPRKLHFDEARCIVRRLYNVSEQQLLKAGICRFLQKMKRDETTEVFNIRITTDDAFGDRVHHKGLLRNLITQALEFKSAMPSDLAAAQPDVRYLSLEQVLSIRAQTVSFWTVSEHHHAHSAFNESLDGNLFPAIARLDESLPVNTDPSRLFAIGKRFAMTMGIVALLNTQPAAGTQEALPPSWACSFGEELWPGRKTAVFNVETLQGKVLQGDCPDFGVHALVVPVERHKGSGADEHLLIDITVVNPYEIDVLNEFARFKVAGPNDKTKKRLSVELTALLAIRAMGGGRSNASRIRAAAARALSEPPPESREDREAREFLEAAKTAASQDVETATSSVSVSSAKSRFMAAVRKVEADHGPGLAKYVQAFKPAHPAAQARSCSARPASPQPSPRDAKRDSGKTPAAADQTITDSTAQADSPHVAFSDVVTEQRFSISVVTASETERRLSTTSRTSQQDGSASMGTLLLQSNPIPHRIGAPSTEGSDERQASASAILSRPRGAMSASAAEGEPPRVSVRDRIKNLESVAKQAEQRNRPFTPSPRKKE